MKLTSNDLDNLRKHGQLKHCMTDEEGRFIEHWRYGGRMYVVTAEVNEE